VRYYSSVAPIVDLTGSISNSATTITVSSTTGFPGTTPFTLVLDPGLATEEIVEVTNVSGLTLTITRAVDGSSAQAHSAGVQNVQHMATARDYAEPQAHIAASQNVHGLSGGSSVVGTDTAQTLKNKTALAASAATSGLIVKGAASQTAAILDVQDSTGASVAKVVPGEGSLSVGTTVLLNNLGTANVFGYIAKIVSGGSGLIGAIIKAAAGQTADLLQLQNSSGTVLAKFDASGNLTAPGATIGGAPVATTTGAQTLTNKTLTAPAVTGLTGDTATLTGAVSAASVATSGNVVATGTVSGANIPATHAATSAGKDKKRLHWGTASGTPDGSGYFTVTHGAGFTPTVVVITYQSVALQTLADTFTATTFRVRVINSDGSVSSTSETISYICGE